MCINYDDVKDKIEDGVVEGIDLKRLSKGFCIYRENSNLIQLNF